MSSALIITINYKLTAKEIYSCRDYLDMQVVVQIVLLSVIGGLAMDCGNNDGDSLTSCQSNPNIRIQKVRGGGGGGKPNRYRLSLNTQNTQNIWWAPPEDNWIKCGDLCDTCKSLPGIGNDGENVRWLVS